MAQKWEYIDHTIDFPAPAKEPKTVRYIPLDHLKRIIAKIQAPEFYDLCTLSCYLGLRSGEALRLVLADVDNQPDYLRIVPLQKTGTTPGCPSTARHATPSPGAWHTPGS